MPDRNGWTYYLYGGLEPGDHITPLRTRRDVAEGLNTQTNEWVAIDSNRISHYIETGEIALNESSRAEIESRFDVSLPD